jgi:hypothetical protein
VERALPDWRPPAPESTGAGSRRWEGRLDPGPRRIDAAVAAVVMAHDRAAALAGTVRDSIYL